VFCNDGDQRGTSTYSASVSRRGALAAVALAAVVLVVVVTSGPTPRQRGVRLLEGPVFGVARDGNARRLVGVDPARPGRGLRLGASLERGCAGHPEE
jgi:hypothetical protein